MHKNIPYTIQWCNSHTVWMVLITWIVVNVANNNMDSFQTMLPDGFVLLAFNEGKGFYYHLAMYHD